MEVVRSDLKTSKRDGHRTPWQILRDFYVSRNEAGLGRWHEYEQATRGLHPIQWSRGLQELTCTPETTDAELTAEHEGQGLCQTVYEFNEPEWRAVGGTPGGRTAVLRAAEHSGAAAVVVFALHESHPRTIDGARKNACIDSRNGLAQHTSERVAAKPFGSTGRGLILELAGQGSSG